jgi:hypothetical protein
MMFEDELLEEEPPDVVFWTAAVTEATLLAIAATCLEIESIND